MVVRLEALMLAAVFILFSCAIRIHHCTTTQDDPNRYAGVFPETTEDGYQQTTMNLDGITAGGDSYYSDHGATTEWEAISVLQTDISEKATTTTAISSIIPAPELSKSSTPQCPEIRTESYTIPESWPGSWAIPTDIICLHDDYRPVRIHCLNNGTWNFTEKLACSSVALKESTEILHNLLLSNERTTATLRNISNILIRENLGHVEIIDVHYVAMILQKFNDDDYSKFRFLDAVADVMKLRKDRLSLSQELLNSTDMILDVLSEESFWWDTNYIPGHFIYTFVIRYFESYTHNMIIRRKNSTNFDSLQHYSDNYSNENTLKFTNFEVALAVTSYSNYTQYIRITLFLYDHLFNQNNDVKTPGSWVISVLSDSSFDVDVYFHEFQSASSQTKTCHFWKYGTENGIAISGKWEFVSKATRFKNGYYKCSFKGPGYFALLASRSNSFVIMCDEAEFQNYTIPETSAGSWAIPKDTICLHEDYTPVRIKCLVDGTWNLTGDLSCSSGNISETTESLYEILNINSTIALVNVSNIIDDAREDLAVIDVHYISQILHKASTDNDVSSNPSDFLKAVDNVMGVRKNLLHSSQKLLNSTDIILYSLDLLLKNSGGANSTTPNLLVRTITPRDNIYGAMLTSEDREDFTSFRVRYLDEDYETTLIDTNFETAFVLPPLNNFDHYHITIFYNDNFFNEESRSATVGSWIVSVLLPDGTILSHSTLKIYFKEFVTTFDQKCQHWEYGAAISGHWSFDNDAVKFKDGYYLCEVNHTTHFGMLVADSAPEDVVADVFTYFGAALSVVGILLIFLTALVFKQWRNKANSKIILNVSLCLLLLIISFIISDKVDEGPSCIVVGMFLHYFVLAQFFWALALSYSSYRRFHTVTGDHVEHVVKKFCAFSWISPLLIIIVTAAINMQTYDKTSGSSQICYPKDIYLTLCLCLPMTIILTVNVVIYILIAKNLLVTKLDIRKHETKRSFAVEKSLILLFFMSAISWIFGLVVAFTENLLFLYVFCATATCHGFVIFVFYVLDSTEIMQLWKEKFRFMTRRKSKAGLNNQRNSASDTHFINSSTHSS